MTSQAGALYRHPALPYVVPFLTFVTLMGLEHAFSLPPLVFYPLRFTVVLTSLLLFSRGVVNPRPSYPLSSIGLGVAVFVIWVAPDVLFGYRHFWLFENSITGKVTSSLSAESLQLPWFLALRTVSSAVVVPVLEELFWRGWLMRWLINSADFERVPMGTYQAGAFWMVALLFASEHGPYWEVGLLAGILYNWWLVRTRNLADCILAHGVTNAVLSAYVISSSQFQYWL